VTRTGGCCCSGDREQEEQGRTAIEAIAADCIESVLSHRSVRQRPLHRWGGKCDNAVAVRIGCCRTFCQRGMRVEHRVKFPQCGVARKFAGFAWYLLDQANEVKPAFGAKKPVWLMSSLFLRMRLAIAGAFRSATLRPGLGSVRPQLHSCTRAASARLSASCSSLFRAHPCSRGMATAPPHTLADGVLSHHTEPLIDNAEPEEHKFDYDLIVIGGGSGGLACSKEAAKLGKKVACLDFVKPSPIGTTWGLGGTCVNVGCIPKKLFHTASIIGESIHQDAKSYGWEVPDKVPFNWEVGGSSSRCPLLTLVFQTLSNNVQDYIGSLNFGYRTELRDKHVDYLNEYGVFVDPHTLECTNRKGEKRKLTARRFVSRLKSSELCFVLALLPARSPVSRLLMFLCCRSLRLAVVPSIRTFPATRSTASPAMTFSRCSKRPTRYKEAFAVLALSCLLVCSRAILSSSCNKPLTIISVQTLVVGASYVALECAGFLNGLGYDATVR
jgi:hypothetical protein